MRTDKTLSNESFGGSEDWARNPLAQGENQSLDARFVQGGETRDGKTLHHSFSGHERNHLFANKRGEQFVDVSSLSGLDNVADSRAFALWDFDRDGWQDIALVNANYPLLNVYRNQLGDRDTTERAGGFLAVRLVGANHGSSAVSGKSTRDAFGAKVYVRSSSATVLRELRCGEGFAAQNSRTLLIGIGASNRADSVRVVWPSGLESEIENVESGALLTLYEDSEQSADGVGATREAYVIPAARPRSRQPLVGQQPTFELTGTDEVDSASLRMYVTMATWCPSCKKHMPQVGQLREVFSNEQLHIFGLPYDRLDTAEMLVEYQRVNMPPYELLMPLPDVEWERLDSLLRRALSTPALPSTIITNSAGEVLRVFLGVPTVSDVRKLLGTSE